MYFHYYDDDNDEKPTRWIEIFPGTERARIIRRPRLPRQSNRAELARVAGVAVVLMIVLSIG